MVRHMSGAPQGTPLASLLARWHRDPRLPGSSLVGVERFVQGRQTIGRAG
jgi:hypothetical protein